MDLYIGKQKKQLTGCSARAFYLYAICMGLTIKGLKIKRLKIKRLKIEKLKIEKLKIERLAPVSFTS